MRYASLLMIVLASACSLNPPAAPEPEFAPIRPIVAVPPPIENGSLYQAGYGVSLFSDVSAKRVGDVITVILQESTNASKSTSTKTDKSSSIDIPSPTIFGGGVTHGGRDVLSASLSTDRQFSGKGDSSQSNSLSGRITVTVAEVLPNGYLVVQGEKRLSLNQGSEHLRVSGIVRPADIRSDNTLLSGNIANAQIIYGGTGTLADAASAGWLTRLFNSPWWPF